MRNYKLDDLRQWKPMQVGEILDFQMPASGFRSVSFDVVAAGPVSIHAVTGGNDYWLVAYGDGFMSSKFALDEPFGLVAIGEAMTDVFIRSQVEAPIIPESEEASYTSIEPRPAGPSDDLRRMMHMVRINQERREAALRAEFQAQLDAQQAPAPEPAPEPAPAASETASE